MEYIQNKTEQSIIKPWGGSQSINKGGSGAAPRKQNTLKTRLQPEYADNAEQVKACCASVSVEIYDCLRTQPEPPHRSFPRELLFWARERRWEANSSMSRMERITSTWIKFQAAVIGSSVKTDSGADAGEVSLRFGKGQLSQGEDHQADAQEAKPQGATLVGGGGIHRCPEDEGWGLLLWLPLSLLAFVGNLNSGEVGKKNPYCWNIQSSLYCISCQDFYLKVSSEFVISAARKCS